MFQIKFYNESGSIIFGGGKSTSPWRLTVAEGLALCGKSFTAARYAGQNGQETTAAVTNARTITMIKSIMPASTLSLPISLVAK